MTVDNGELRFITDATIPDSLEWEYFAGLLTQVKPEYLGNIEFAFSVAKEAHSKLPPRDTGEPNFSHPLMATIYLVQAGCIHPSHIQGCLLHDVPEDNLTYLLGAQNRIFTARTGIDLGDAQDNNERAESAAFDLIERQFGYNTAEIVTALTKSPSVATTPREKAREELDCANQLRYGPPGCWVDKAADRLHNLRTPRPGDPTRILRKIEETRRWYMPVFEMGARAFPGEGVELIMEIHRTMRMQEMALR